MQIEQTSRKKIGGNVIEGIAHETLFALQAHQIQARLPTEAALAAVLNSNSGIAIVVALHAPVEGQGNERGRFDTQCAAGNGIACHGCGRAQQQASARE